jgi:hypothetical protein
VLQHPNYGPLFLSRLSAVVLDEVDVLLPLASKNSRTSLDSTVSRRGDGKSSTNAGEMERRKQQEDKQRLAQKKKMLATKRAGAELTSDNKQVIVPTEQLLRLIAMSRPYSRDATSANGDLQVLAGSATASRRTLDRLNRAMRAASAAANTDFERVWSSDVKVCRPPGQVDGNNNNNNNNDDDDDDDTSSDDTAGSSASIPHQHTIRAVTVPSQVNHRYISLSKEAALSSDAALSAVAKIANLLQPQRALVFLCGEFAKQPSAPAARREPVGSKARGGRNSKRIAKPAGGSFEPSAASLLSARKTCDILGTHGIHAKVSRRVCGVMFGFVRFGSSVGGKSVLSGVLAHYSM